MNATRRILMVDDDPAAIDFYFDLLRAEGYEVRGESSGRQGFLAACEWRPDIVLLDVMLPDLSGIEVCRQIKSNAKLSETFVVLFSGHAADPSHKVKGLEAGADDYLVKAMHPEELLARIRGIVRARDAGAALRASEQHYRQLVEFLPEALGEVDLEGRITTANARAAAMLGYPNVEEVLGRSVFDLTPPEDHERLRVDIAAALATGSVINCGYTLTRKSGQRFPVELSVTASRRANRGAVRLIVLARDMSERKRLEKDLLQISDAERRRIGHELHDGLGQYLAGIAFRAKALEQALAREALHTRAEEARELATFISSAISQTRSLSHGLDSIEVEASGLLDSLQNLVAETRSFFNIDCCLHCGDPALQVDAPTSLALYRVVQEAVHNAITHGKARRVEIELADIKGCLCLRIQDDGAGFEVQSGQRRGMGLRVMEYRARSVGAKLTINSKPGRGTEIRCDLSRATCLPVAEEFH
jgi:two-component system, LuxR family, sensor kinase FixL